MAGVAHKSWWGPRIWRILHCLAELTDRPGCVVGWRHVIQETAAILPCDMCREHFVAAMRSERITAGSVRHMLWSAHTGSRQAEHAEGNLPESELSAVYGYGGDRGSVAAEVGRLVTEIVDAFRSQHVLDRFRIGHLVDWERAVRRLARDLLLPVPSVPSGPASSRGRGRGRGPGRAR